jgi:hypothetical protein
MIIYELAISVGCLQVVLSGVAGLEYAEDRPGSS